MVPDGGTSSLAYELTFGVTIHPLDLLHAEMCP